MRHFRIPRKYTTPDPQLQLQPQLPASRTIRVVKRVVSTQPTEPVTVIPEKARPNLDFGPIQRFVKTKMDAIMLLGGTE